MAIYGKNKTENRAQGGGTAVVRPVKPVDRLPPLTGGGTGVNVGKAPRPTTGAGGAGSAGTGRPSSGGGSRTDALGNIDYSSLWNERMNSGNATLAELEQIARNRAEKASGGGAYSGYYMDDKQREMYAYLDYMKSQQQPENPFGAYGSLEEYMDAVGYGKVSEAEQAAIDAYIKQTVNGLESQKQGVAQNADELARQAYISYMQSQSALPQALAASGYSGGMADSQRLALETGLQNNQREIAVNRDNTLSGIDSAIINAQLEGSIQGAQAQADLGRDAISAFQQYMQQQNAYANQNYWNKYGYDFQAAQNQQNQQWQSGENQADREQTGAAQAQKLLQQQALEMIQAGKLPDDAMLEAAGISKTYAQTMAPVYAAQLAGQGGGGSGGGGGYYGESGNAGADAGLPTTGKVSQEQYDAAARRFMAGDYGADVLDALLTVDDPDTLSAAAGLTRDPMGLNYGPISMERLAALLASGEVQAVNIGGVTYYKRAAASGGGSFTPPAL